MPEVITPHPVAEHRASFSLNAGGPPTSSIGNPDTPKEEAPALARVKRAADLEPRLLELLRKKIEATGLSHRKIERQFNLSHGTVGNLLSGHTALRLRHLDILATAIGYAPDELLLEVLKYPPPRVDLQFAQIVADKVVASLRSQAPATTEASEPPDPPGAA